MNPSPPRSDTRRAIDEASDAARAFLLGPVADIWSRRGEMRNGLFPERFALSGAEDIGQFRTFVQARHIFSFAAIGALGWTGPWQALIAEALGTLVERAKRPDGFFIHALDASGDPLDSRADLYDQAFVLFALGVGGSSLQRSDLFDEAESLLSTVERNWRHSRGGFLEGEIADPHVRRQNPHMHLLEAFLALSEGSGRSCFAEAALRIAELAGDRFIDPASGALLEYFTDDLQPAAGEEGRIAEPGHCFEWAWLFERLARQSGDGKWLRLSDGLTGFGRLVGVDAERGVAINEVLTSGKVRDPRARLWPQTERLKAAAVRFRRLNSDEEAAEVLAANTGLIRYFDVPTPGLWRDKLNADGTWVEEFAPGSSLYHISCAYTEMLAI